MRRAGGGLPDREGSTLESLGRRARAAGDPPRAALRAQDPAGGVRAGCGGDADPFTQMLKKGFQAR